MKLFNFRLREHFGRTASAIMVVPFIACFGLSGLGASEHQPPPKRSKALIAAQDRILDQIKACALTHPLNPVIADGERTYTLSCIEKGAGDDLHVTGVITRNGVAHNACFSVRKLDDSSESEVQLLYLTKNRPIAFALFLHIRNFTATLLPDGLSNCNIVIENVREDCLPTRSIEQKWTFFNAEQQSELSILVGDHARGGVYYVVRVERE